MSMVVAFLGYTLLGYYMALLFSQEKQMSHVLLAIRAFLFSIGSLLVHVAIVIGMKGL